MTNITRGAALLALGLAAAACTSDVQVVAPPAKTANSIFQSYVALGNSITAGWQSGGINDATQRQSYAYLLAKQMQTRFAYPAFALFGCPAPVGDFVTQQRIDSLVPAAQRQSCYLRNPASITEVLNNVGVPYAYAADMTSSTPIVPSNPLWNFILGGKTMVDRALEADPTFATVWLGNNEVLLPASVGMLDPRPNAPPLIPPTVWIPQYKAGIDALIAGAPNLKGGVLVGVVDVTNIPRFWSADSLVTNARLKAQLDTVTGHAAAPLAVIGCGASGYLMSVEIINQIKAGTHPAAISCIKNTPAAPVGDIFMLDPVEVATFSGTVAAYNAYIHAKADSIGFAYFDPNPLLASARASGAVPRLPNLMSRSAPFGPLFSLDGAHPSGAAQLLIAQALVDAINAKYGTTIPKP